MDTIAEKSKLDVAIEEKSKIYQRLKEVREIVNSTLSAKERAKQTSRLKILRDMYRDACDEVERLRPAENKKHTTAQKKTIHADAVSWDFFERSSVVWSDLGGYTWNALGELQETSDANGAMLLRQLLYRAYNTLTDRQQYYIQKCFIEKRRLCDVATEEGVNRSTVCRTIKAGLHRIESAIISSLYAYECIVDDTFDHMKWAEVTEALTERQRELLYFLLSDDAPMSMISDFLMLNKSTVSRTNERIVGRMVKANDIIPKKRPARIIKRKEWRNKSEDEIAAKLGISKGTYYRNICRNRPVGDISRFAYECLKCRGIPVSEAAKRLNCSPETVKKYWNKYADIDINNFEAPKEYSPEKVKRKESVNVRSLLSNVACMEGTIGSAISGETYRKMISISKGGVQAI